MSRSRSYSDAERPPSRPRSRAENFEHFLEEGVELADKVARGGQDIENVGRQVSKAGRVAKEVGVAVESEYFDGRNLPEVTRGKSPSRTPTKHNRSDTESSTEEEAYDSRRPAPPSSSFPVRTDRFPDSRTSARTNRTTPSPPFIKVSDSRPPSRNSSVLPLFSDKSSEKSPDHETPPTNGGFISVKRELKKLHSVEDLEAVIHETSQLIKKASEELQEIQYRRQQHTGPYKKKLSFHDMIFKNKNTPFESSRIPDGHDHSLKDAQALASLIATSAETLRKAYKGLAILDRHSPLQKTNDDLGLGSKDKNYFEKKIAKLYAKFEALKAMVEELARQELREVEKGVCDQRMVRWIHQRFPGHQDHQVLSTLSLAKSDAKRQSLSSMNLESAGAQIVLQNPFTNISNSIAHLSRERNSSRASCNRDDQTNTGFLSGMFSRTSKGVDKRSSKGRLALETGHRSKKSSRSTPSRAMYEPGKPGGAGDGHNSDFSTTDTEIFGSDIEKQGFTSGLLGGLPPPYSSTKSSKSKKPKLDQFGNPTETPDGRPLGPDGRPIVLGYRVPTDDPEDSETPSELIEDARDKVVMEHIVIPLSILFWICIFGVLIYWGVSRVIGNENPLGNVDLGQHFGNDAWNDTTDGSWDSTTSVSGSFATVVNSQVASLTSSSLSSAASTLLAISSSISTAINSSLPLPR